MASEDIKIPLQETVYKPTTEEFFEEVGEDGKRPRDTVLLYLSGFAASLLTFGTIIVWTSATTARLKSDSEENPLGRPVSTMELSLLGGLPLLGSLFGAMFLTKLCDLIGRKKMLMMMSLLMLLSHIMLAFAQTLLLYYIARFVVGLGMGAALAGVAIFLSEIAEDHNRGAIGCFIGLSFPLGNLYGYIIGPLFSIKNFTLLCSVPYILQLFAFVLFVPESPVYFASKGNRTDALKSLKKLRNKSVVSIEKEYAKIVHALKRSEHKDGLKTLLSTRSSRRGLIIAIGLNIIQQLSGVAAILAFAAPLFDAAHTGISGHTVGILIGSIKVGSVFLATVVIERSGRRPLLMVSTMGSGIFLFILGIFFYLQSIKFYLIDYILWLPILAIVLYFVFYGIGIGAIPNSIPSQLFPSSIRSTATSVTTVVMYAFCLIITTSFPILVKVLGEAWCLWAYSIFTLGGYVFVYLLVPEIKGKSFLEVQEILSR